MQAVREANKEEVIFLCTILVCTYLMFDPLPIVSRLYSINRTTERPAAESTPPFARPTGASLIRVSSRLNSVLAETADDLKREVMTRNMMNTHEQQLLGERFLDPERFSPVVSVRRAQLGHS